MRNFLVYIITNRNRRVLYIDVTSNMEQRLWQHREKQVSGFSARYNLVHLLYVETYPDAMSAIAREKATQTVAARQEGPVNRIGESALVRH